MAHGLTEKNGRSSMARRAGTDAAWHEQDGFRPGIFDENDTLETLLEKASMDFHVAQYPLVGMLPCGQQKINDYVGIYREDYDGQNRQLLSIQSPIYKPVQTAQIMDFFKREVEKVGFKLDTAGVIKNGRVYWACADGGRDIILPGGDKVSEYLTLLTSNDGTLATQGFYGNIRVVCNNTLTAAANRQDRENRFRQTHRGFFDPDKASLDLGLRERDLEWNQFCSNASMLADIHPSKKKAVEFLTAIFGDAKKAMDDQTKTAIRDIEGSFALYQGKGMGSLLQSSRDTAWGLVNGVTEYIDHVKRAHTAENRFSSSLYGPGAVTKRAAYELACQMGSEGFKDASIAFNESVQDAVKVSEDQYRNVTEVTFGYEIV